MNAGLSGPSELRCVVLSAGADGISHFDEDLLPWTPLYSDYPDGPQATAYHEAASVGFLRLPVGRRSPWHPAPGKRFVLVLTGTMEIVAGDGEAKQFGAGDVLLVTDVEGTGHRTNVIGNSPVLAAWVPLG